MYRTDAPQSDVSAPFPLSQWLSNGKSGWVLGLIPLSLVIWFLSMLGPVTAGTVITASWPWVPSLGINLSFAIDGLSLLFALIVSGIGTLIIIYAGGYMAGDPQIGRLYLYLFLFMGAMLGLVLSDNIITLFVFWELTSITSYLLIGFKHAYTSSRVAALQALLVTGAGGLAMLAGLILLAIAGGSMQLSALVEQRAAIQASGLYPAILALVVLGAFTKSAQFPFHFWLPGAMAAPTPVSAYLHSATMVKAGVYLLARLSPTLGGTPAWQVVLVTFGGITMFLGAYLAVLQVDLKRILAFTTVSALGTLVMLIGIGTEYAFTAMIVFLVVHSLYKGALFMVAGAIDHESGTRDISGLGGLFRVMPFTGVAAALAALSMSGFPPFYGFIGKEYIYDATLKMDTGMLIVTAVAVLSNMLMIVGAGMVAIKPFYGEKKETPKKAHEAPFSMWLGPATLAVLSLFLGLAWTGGGEGITPGSFAEPLSNQAVGAIAGEETHIHLYLIPDGISTKVILSTLTILVGTLGYFYARTALQQSGQPVRGWLEAGPERAYTNIVEGMQALARWQTKTFQGGYLRYYMLTVVATVVGITALALLTRTQALDFPIRWVPQATLSQWFIAVVMLGGALYMTQARTRLAAVVGLGAVGLGMSLVFVFNSAPDLAMTQFSIETLSVILFVLVLYRLPEFSSVSSQSARIRDAVVALAAGALMTFLVLAVNANPAEPLLSPYFAETSYEIAHGRNIVNVILVDYRALDTLGEITVLAIAALGIFALLKLRPPGMNTKQAPGKVEAVNKDKEQEQA